MKALLTILLLGFLNADAQMPAVAMGMTATRLHSGILVAGSGQTVAQKSAIAKDSLHCETVRMNIVLSTYSGSSSAFDTYLAKGLKVICNISYYAPGSQQPFPTSAELPDLISKLTSFLNDYGAYITILVVENEELTSGYHSGPVANYVAEVQAVYNVCHPRGILVMNGGIGGLSSGFDCIIWRYLNSLSTAKSAEYATHMSNGSLTNAQTPGSNANMEFFVRQMDTLQGMRNYIDIFNFHTKEVQDNTGSDHSTVTTITPHSLMYKADYARSIYKKMLADNETGADNSQPTLVTSEVNEYIRLGFVQMQWWSGTGPNAAPLHDDTTGAIYLNGDAFKNSNDSLNK